MVRAYDKKTGAVLSELNIPGMMGSMPMTYMVNGKQYIAFTVGTRAAAIYAALSCNPVPKSILRPVDR